MVMSKLGFMAPFTTYSKEAWLVWWRIRTASKADLVTYSSGMTATLKGKVLTVCGPVEPSQLGIILPHEQPMCDLTGLLKVPDTGFGSGECHSDLKMTVENLGKIRQYPYSVRTNLILDSVEDAVAELKSFKAAGGATLCDVSPIGIRLNREFLPQISQETGLNIIASSALYIDRFMAEKHKLMTAEELTTLLVSEVLDGIAGFGVKCGIIGEVGCSFPLHDTERKSLIASTKAHQMTGAPMMIHPGACRTSPFDILDVLEEAHADLSQVAFAHLERTLSKTEDLLRLAGKGCYLEFDLFGAECSHSQLNPSRDYPSDSDRIKMVKVLIDNGFSDQILISSDIHSKHRQARYGGHGYCHILHYVVPKMISRGISKETTQKLITTNPQRWLTFH